MHSSSFIFSSRFTWRILAIAAASLALALFVLTAFGGLRALGLGSSCLYKICVGRPLPQHLLASATATDGDTVRIDARQLGFLNDIVEFRAGFEALPPERRTDNATLLIWRDQSGRVTRVRLQAEFAAGTYLWAPHQKPLIERAMRKALGFTPPCQQIDWQRQLICFSRRAVSGTAALGRIWPGSGGHSAAMIELGQADFVTRPER